MVSCVTAETWIEYLGSNLKLFLPFDEESGNPIDYSGNMHTATLEGVGSKYIDGLYNNALSLNGSGYVSLGDNFNVGTSDWTFIFYLNCSAEGRIIDKSAYTSTWLNYFIYIDSDLKLKYYLGNGTSAIGGVSTTVFNDAEWHFAAVVLDRSGNAFIKVDNGTAEGTQDISSLDGQDISNGQDCFIGRIPWVAAGYYTGSMDTFMIVESALTVDQLDFLQEEIEEYYTVTPTPTPEPYTNEEVLGISIALIVTFFSVVMVLTLVRRKSKD